MSAAILPLRRIEARPIHSFRQVFIIGGEPYVFIAERWREEDLPAGEGAPTASLIPGHVLTGRVIRTNTGEIITPFSAWIEVHQPAVVVG